MTKDFNRRVTNVYWSYRWTFGANPTVFFANPKVMTNVIYTLSELQNIVERSDSDNSFIPVPKQVLRSALSAIRFENTLAA